MERDRPLERRASVRTAVVWDACRARLDGASDQTVIDIGGGTGGFAVRVAELGHRVTVIDPSPDALAALGRRAEERGVADRVVGQQGDLASLPELVESGSADLVLCHDVLGLVDDPRAALRTIHGVLRPGGALSLLVGQRHAAVLAKAMAGHFGEAVRTLDGEDGAERRFTAEEIAGLLAATGFSVAQTHAVRVFADLVPSTLLDLEPGAVAGLLELERAVAERPEYLALAAAIHTVSTV
ncbi:methyltransferase domain-containing protein [Nocardioides marmorisolisilvae]|uniref:Methyltransferase domain-containing protein n=1 Tax=Nocardioides marmorisolisilvae TaxID=1542737 RepID=A0A3N0DW60_9ACTN|nr:methyltransferase domain-containing protein [Nocardioides marmorisolisilvae]RNL79736.1 methyltransferase domain-containing protein [Nocardioides marmorisolisilvae]